MNVIQLEKFMNEIRWLESNKLYHEEMRALYQNKEPNVKQEVNTNLITTSGQCAKSNDLRGIMRVENLKSSQ